MRQRPGGRRDTATVSRPSTHGGLTAAARELSGRHGPPADLAPSRVVPTAAHGDSLLVQLADNGPVPARGLEPGQPAAWLFHGAAASTPSHWTIGTVSDLLACGPRIASCAGGTARCQARSVFYSTNRCSTHEDARCTVGSRRRRCRTRRRRGVTRVLVTLRPRRSIVCGRPWTSWSGCRSTAWTASSCDGSCATSPSRRDGSRLSVPRSSSMPRPQTRARTTVRPPRRRGSPTRPEARRRRPLGPSRSAAPSTGCRHWRTP